MASGIFMSILSRVAPVQQEEGDKADCSECIRTRRHDRRPCRIFGKRKRHCVRCRIGFGSKSDLFHGGAYGDGITYQIREGHIDIVFKDLSEKGKLLVDSFFIGICKVQEVYADYIQIR